LFCHFVWTASKIENTEDIKYPEPERNAVNPNEETKLAWKSSTGPPTQAQPQHPKSSSSKVHGASHLQNATPTDSGRPATHERNPGPNDRPSESKPRRVPDGDVGEGSTGYHAKFAAPHSSSEGEVARLELERQLSVLLFAQTERDLRITRLTALLEQSEAKAAGAAKRAGAAGLELREHADRLVMQTSLVKQRDAELVDMQARVRDLRSQFSDSQTTVQRLESQNKRITRELNEAADQHKNKAERLKNGMEELKANHETAIAQARAQAGNLQRDNSDLQQSLDTLKAEMARSNHRLPRMGSPLTPEGRERSDLPTPNDCEIDDVFSPAPSTGRGRGDTPAMFSADGNFNSSPDVSPSRRFQAPSHPNDEVEALPQYERELTSVRAKLEANESELEAVRLRLTDAEKGLAKTKAEADILRAQTATGSMNRDEDQVTRMLMERVRALEEVASKRWNEKSIEDMECRNEG
jgi:septal ring factor EnvC (AmiA/AmiB activator)